jgi:hypothetical protein
MTNEKIVYLGEVLQEILNLENIYADVVINERSLNVIVAKDEHTKLSKLYLDDICS